MLFEVAVLSKIRVDFLGDSRLFNGEIRTSYEQGDELSVKGRRCATEVIKTANVSLPLNRRHTTNDSPNIEPLIRLPVQNVILVTQFLGRNPLLQSLRFGGGPVFISSADIQRPPIPRSLKVGLARSQVPFTTDIRLYL